MKHYVPDKYCKEMREIVYSTVKNITHIGVWDSDDGQSLEIKIVFGSKSISIPIKYKNIEENFHSSKDFLKLIIPPLEAILEPYLRKAGEKC